MSDAGGRLSNRDAAELSGQIAGLAGAGLPLGPGLRALGEEMPSGRLRRVLYELARALDAGEPLETAITATGSKMPAHLRGLVLAGAKTGRIGQVLGRLAGYVNVGDDLRRDLLLKLAYPCLTIVLAAALFVFVCTIVLSAFDAIFQDFGMPVPSLTRFLFMVARAGTSSWKSLLETMFGLGVLVTVVGLFAGGPNRRAVAGSIPIIGPVWRWTSLAEFCHLLGLLLESELPMVEAVSLSGEGVRDAAIRSACRSMSAGLTKGQSLAQAMSSRRVFPAGMIRIVEWSEGNRGLAETLHMLGEMFEASARSQALFAGTACSFMAIVIVVTGVVMTVSAVMIPMVTMITRLSG